MLIPIQRWPVRTSALHVMTRHDVQCAVFFLSSTIPVLIYILHLSIPPLRVEKVIGLSHGYTYTSLRLPYCTLFVTTIAVPFVQVHNPPSPVACTQKRYTGLMQMEQLTSSGGQGWSKSLLHRVTPHRLVLMPELQLSFVRSFASSSKHVALSV